LFDHNVTRGALKNLVTDKPSPITVALAQRSDADNLSTLFDHNVTRGALKNLVTDKPSPITVALSQKQSVAQSLVKMEKTAKDDKDIDHILNDHNVTKGHLKNLITDRPAPITKPLDSLAQQPNEKNAT